MQQEKAKAKIKCKANDIYFHRGVHDLELMKFLALKILENLAKNNVVKVNLEKVTSLVKILDRILITIFMNNRLFLWLKKKIILQTFSTCPYMVD